MTIRRLLASSMRAAAGVSLAAAAVPAATIEGHILDAESGEPMGYAAVKVDGELARKGVLSDVDGSYAIEGLRRGRYTLSVSFVGYETLERPFVITDGRAALRVDVRLRPEPIEVDGVTVEANRLGEDLGLTGVVNVDRQLLSSVPGVAEADPIRALQLLPGVQAASDISSGLYVRGGGPDQTLILLDRVPIYNPTHAFGFFSTFNGDAVDDVTLYKGGYPAAYGGRLGAVLDVRGREGSRTRAKGNLGVSLVTGRLTLEGPLDESGSWIIGLRRTYLDPILDAIRSGGTDVPAYYFYDVNAKINFTPAGGDRLVWSVYSGRDDLRFDFDEATYVDLRWGNTAMSGEYTHSFSDDLVGTARLSGTEYESVSVFSIATTGARFENGLRDLTAQAELSWEASHAHRLRVGVEATQYDFRLRQRFNEDETLDFAADPISYVLFGEDVWRASAGTVLRAGLRSRYISDGRRTFIEPRATLTQELGARWTGKLAAGVYNQYLQLVATEGFAAADFYVPIDEFTEPGRSRQLVAGLEWRPSRRYRVSVEAYDTDLRNLVELDSRNPADDESTATSDVFVTGGEGYTRGVELFAERRVGPVTGWIGYSLGWSRRRYTELNDGRSFPPKYDRRHDVSVVARVERGRWTFGGAFVAATGQAFTPAAARYSLTDPATGVPVESGLILSADRNSKRLLPYHRLDVSVTRDFGFFGYDAEWFVQVFNLYSRRNEWFVQYDVTDTSVDPVVAKMLPIIPSFGINVSF